MLRMWNPVPNVEAYRSGRTRWISAAWNLPLFALAVVGAFRWLWSVQRQQRWIVLFLLLPAVYFSLLHCLYVGSVRYRLPAVPMMAVLAAMAISARNAVEEESLAESRQGL